jgi:hypothetical protein
MLSDRGWSPPAAVVKRASIMVKPMPANKASKVKIGNVVDVGDVGEDKADNVGDA